MKLKFLVNLFDENDAIEQLKEFGFASNARKNQNYLKFNKQFK